MAKNPRQRKAEAKAQPHAAADLIAALRFVAAAQKKAGPIYQTHCAITKGAVMAYDGLMTIGHRIADDLHACPNTAKLIDALNKCGQNISIATLDHGRIQVKSDKFKAIVPCVNFDDIPYSEPNPQGGPIDDKVKAAIKAASLLTNESSETIHLAATLLQANTAVGTNGHALIECWHGWDLPPNVLLPKAAVHAIVTCPKPLTGFGFNGRSATFYFGDDAFIKTQLFEGRYANYLPLLEVPTLPAPLPPDFFTALDKVASFAEGGVYMDADAMRSHDSREQGASYEMEGLTPGMAFDPDYLNMLKPFISTAYFEPSQHKMHFFADKFARGIILGIRRK